MAADGLLGGLLALPVRRPVATGMFFLALSLLGLFAWYRIPIELIPALSGEELYVQIFRPGSEPEALEREVLLPMEARISELSGIDETSAEVVGASARLTVRFERGVDTRVRELEISRMAAELNRLQPQGSAINVGSEDSSLISRLVLQLQISGSEDPASLRDFVEERLQPRLASVPGVSQAIIAGAPGSELTVWIDPRRCAAVGVQPAQVSAALTRSVQRLRYLGGSESAGRRWSVMLDGRPGGVVSLGEIRIDPARPVLLRHVADIELGAARQESVFRINGRPALGLILFQDEGANLVQLGRELRGRIDELREEFAPFGLGFDIGFDASQTVQDQIDHLGNLALSGFLIALAVLYLFLREICAVAVVALAVPVSLLAAGAMLYLGGWTLNVITLSGLAVGVGMLIDNSIVVYEAVQRCLERGLSPESAAIQGIARTVRAILTACATTAVVFLPATFLVDNAIARSLLTLVSVAILLPLGASLLVAAFLVPLLAQRLAAPAALARRRRRGVAEGEAGLQHHPAQLLISGLLKSALRRPAPWVTGTTVAVLLTLVVALPWVLVRSAGQTPGDSDEIRLSVEMEGSSSLDAASLTFARLEEAARTIEGVETINSNFQEDSGTLTVFLLPEDERPQSTNAARVRRVVYEAAEGLSGVSVDPVSAAGDGGGDGGGGGPFGGGDPEILLSGPDMGLLQQLAADIRERLEAVPGVDSTSLSGRRGQEELRVIPRPAALDSYRLLPENVLGALRTLRREGTPLQVGFTLPDGREIPLSLRQRDSESARAVPRIEDLPIASGAGALPLGELAEVRREPPAPTIVHRDGRRALTLSYRLDEDAPESGPARLRLDAQVRDAVRAGFLPEGYSVETPDADDSGSLIGTLFLPMLLLLYAVLAIAFESLTLPLLILLAVPLTILGATWALVLAGLGADMFAAVGAVALLGLSVNPAILLVDRMQRRRLDSGCSGGAAAIAAVKERTRPVLMTSATTIAGLWPLAVVTGRDLELWPPFATVIIGGLATATLLTLLIIPLGFVFLARLDTLFARLGPWGLMAWGAATAVLTVPLILSGQLVSLYWQIVTAALIAAALLWPARKLFDPRRPRPLDTSRMSLEAHSLGKIYGLPGPVSRALQAPAAAGRSARDRAERSVTFLLPGAGAAWLSLSLDSVWVLLFAFLAGGFTALTLIELRRLWQLLPRRSLAAAAHAGGPAWPAAGGGHSAATNSARDRAIEATLLYASPWIVLALLYVRYSVLPAFSGDPLRTPAPLAVFLLLGLVIALLQAGRFTARGLAAGRLAPDAPSPWRKAWRRASRKFFGLGLDSSSFTALHGVSFRAEEGMIGILGPNGAGKTTLLRLLAGVLSPTSGTVHFAGRERRGIDAETLSGLIGYLPQEFGLPDHLSAEEYLHYYAILYRVGDPATRRERVDRLLREVGLDERRRDRIGGYSGGMRQRVAVARTLLRLPPVIIVDEPTVGLDPRERIRFRNLLAKLAAGRVVLFSTHVVEDVAVSCGRVLVLAAGRIVYDDAPERLAALARGQVWELPLGAGESADLAAGARVIDQVPDAGGTRLRILAGSAPHPRAVAAEPTLEDGYLYLQREETLAAKEART